MKSLVLILISVFSSFFGFNQSEETKSTSPNIEIQVSGNRTIINDGNTYNKMGFGAGINIVSTKNKTINFVFGFHFNKTKQIKKETNNYGGKVGGYGIIYNKEFIRPSICLSVLGRYNFGNNKSLFFEQGLFVSMPFDCGTIGGLGKTFPIKNLDFVVKLNYVFGAIQLNNLLYGPGSHLTTPVYNQFMKLSLGIRL